MAWIFKKKWSRISAPFCYLLYLSTTLCSPLQNLSKGVNVISNGSPSLILIVLLISLGITTLPRSSILLTMPVAFIEKSPQNIFSTLLLVAVKKICRNRQNKVSQAFRNGNTRKGYWTVAGSGI